MSKSSNSLPPEAAFLKNAYTVEIKPIDKYYPRFGAETLAEIEEWLNANAEWVFGSSAQFQSRAAKNNKSEPLIITKMTQRSNANGDGFVMRRCEDFDSRSLFWRQTPKAAE
jgi:hypothetical protein